MRGRSDGSGARMARTARMLGCSDGSDGADARMARTLGCSDARMAWTARMLGCSDGLDGSDARVLSDGSDARMLGCSCSDGSCWPAAGRPAREARAAAVGVPTRASVAGHVRRGSAIGLPMCVLRPIAVYWVALDTDLRRWLGMELRISRMLAYRMLHSGASAFGQRRHCTACGTVWLRPLCSAGADLRGQVQRRGVVFDLAPRMQPPAAPRAAAPFTQFSAARGPLSVVRRLRSSGNPPGHLACACG